MLRPRSADRFRPEALFRPASVLLIGDETPIGRRVAANLAGFAGPVRTGRPGDPADPADLTILACDTADVAAALTQLGRDGARACVCLVPAPGLAAMAEAAGLRVLGPAAFGIATPSLSLDATTSHVPIPRGKVALVSQSAALCRAVLDWAAPNGVGFSHVVGLGGAAQTGFAMVLDYLSRDAATGAILLDIRTVRDRRAFIASARAAARLRPVVAVHAGGRLHDPSGRQDAVLDAALRRAGVLRAGTFADLLGALEVLTRARPARSERLVIATNAVGPAHMAADAAVALGLPLLEVDEVARTVLQLHLPEAPMDPGIVWTGADAPTRVAETAAMLSGLSASGGVVAILTPTGPEDGAAIAALAAASRTMRAPLLACVPGESTGAAHRRSLAEAGVPVFATPEEAVRAFFHLVRQRRARAAAAELPSRRVLDVAPDLHAAARSIACGDGAGLARAYGIEPPPPGIAVESRDDAVFGPAIAATLDGRTELELPPLNLALAQALLDRLGTALPLADTLVRVGQLMQDQPDLAWLRLTQGGLEFGLRPAGQRAWFAIPAYPADLAERFDARGLDVEIRPIRPEDAEAHAALFARLSPEDVRFRFFSMLRALSPEQIARMTQVDYDREMAFVAVHAGVTLGVARLVLDPAIGAEFAVVVEPASKGRGLARRLMERLMDWGRTQGLESITGQVLADNAPMLAFMRRMGATIHRIPGEAEVVEAVIPL